LKIIYAANPLLPKQVDPDYEREAQVAERLGFEVCLLNFEELVIAQDAKAAIRQIKAAVEYELALYRGWMLQPKQYSELYYALKSKNIELLNSPNSYQHCHYLPESYHLIKDYTSKTIWFRKEELSDCLVEIQEGLRQTFGQTALILKDYVKSCKHEWQEACFIPDASNFEQVKKVVKRFLELQGAELNEGLVFREFLKLEFLTMHSQSKMPLTKEFRVFFLNGEPLQVFDYWDEGDYGELKLDLTPFLEVAQKIESCFFTMDLAKVEQGGWVIVELGDGQVAGLPEKANVEEFYSRLKERTMGR